jgi:hypothetical protein
MIREEIIIISKYKLFLDDWSDNIFLFVKYLIPRMHIKQAIVINNALKKLSSYQMAINPRNDNADKSCLSLVLILMASVKRLYCAN